MAKTESLERIALLAAVLKDGYRESAARLQRAMRDTGSKGVPGWEKACEDYARGQDELAALLMRELPATAERCDLICRVTMDARSHYYTIDGFDWSKFKQQCHIIEVAATRAGHIEGESVVKILSDRSVQVAGKVVRLSKVRMIIIKALIDARPNRLTTSTLEEITDKADAAKTVRAMAKTAPWCDVILLPNGEKGLGFGIR